MMLPDNLCSNCRNLPSVEQNYRIFISKLSHEIRNPLTLIYSSLQLLEQDCPAVTSHELWPQIQQDILTTVQLLQDVSSLNRQKQPVLQPISVKNLVDQTAASFCALMHNRQIHFSVTYSLESSCVQIRADECLLREALTNLLINAADAVSNDGEIQLHTEISKDMLCIHVRDNGCGIPDEYLDTLFDPFVTHKSNGTGLGLHIVQTAALQHNGKISVSSCIDPGHTFTDFCLALPLYRD